MNRYKTTIKNEDSTYQTTMYPPIEEKNSDIYITTKMDDRLDLYAYHYYNDVSLWWIIVQANKNLNGDSMFLDPGLRIRIPIDINSYLKNLKDV